MQRRYQNLKEDIETKLMSKNRQGRSDHRCVFTRRRRSSVRRNAGFAKSFKIRSVHTLCWRDAVHAANVLFKQSSYFRTREVVKLYSHDATSESLRRFTTENIAEARDKIGITVMRVIHHCFCGFPRTSLFESSPPIQGLNLSRFLNSIVIASFRVFAVF
jgi:hypothetical protein